MHLSERIAKFVYESNWESLGEAENDRIKCSILDYVGCTMAGTNEKSSQVVREIINVLNGEPQASVWGVGLKTTLPLAAMANANSAHALDYDDVNSIMMGHPSIQLLPGLFSLGEYFHNTGKDLILAFAIGFEIGGRLSRAMNPEHVTQGWLPIGTIGMLMQTTACAKILKLTPKEIQVAVGIATNLASGNRCNNGTMAKHFLAGHVASSGILCTLLAREGMDSSLHAIEDKHGFFDVFCNKQHSDLEHSFKGLGVESEIAISGINHKLYPACAGTHAAVDSTLDMLRENEIRLDDIDRINVKASSVQKTLLIHPRPKTVAEGKFSMEYCVARALLDNKLGPEQFTAQKIDDTRVRNLMGKIRTEYVDDFPRASNESDAAFPAEVTIQMKNASQFRKTVMYAKGTARKPLTFDEVGHKYEECCKGIISDTGIAKSKNIVRNFEELKEISELVSLLS